MKKIINIVLFALTIGFVGNVDARRLIRLTIQITPNEKAMLTNTKALKNPSLTPEQKKQAEIQLAINLAKDKDAPLLLREQQLQEDIEAVKAEIKSMQEENGYLGLLFDSEDLAEAKKDLKEFEKELFDVQRKLKRAGITQPKAVMSLKKWAMVSFIAAVGLAAADQLITGGVGRTAVMGGISTAGSAIKSGASTAWSYAPSLTGSTTANEAALAAAAGAWDMVKSAGAMVITQKIANQMMMLLEDPNTDQSEKDEIKETLNRWEAEKAEQQR